MKNGLHKKIQIEKHKDEPCMDIGTNPEKRLVMADRNIHKKTSINVSEKEISIKNMMSIIFYYGLECLYGPNNDYSLLTSADVPGCALPL